MSGLSKIVVEAKGIDFKVNHKQVLQSVNLNIENGKVYVITGPSGSGKTTLAKILGNELNPTNGSIKIHGNNKILFVSQQDGFTQISGLRTSYYSQRYESPNEEGIPTVENYLNAAVNNFHKNQLVKLPFYPELEGLLQRKLLSLSNGERKRIQLTVELLKYPDLLVLDQPFIGLDVRSREKLSLFLQKWKKKGKAQVIVSDPEHIPDFTDFIVEMKDGTIEKNISFSDFDVSEVNNAKNQNDTSGSILNELIRQKNNYQLIVRMKNINVVLGGRQILSDINWEVKPGEKWVLKGHNGAGKTTLLSLITADNPQGYTNDLVLFDRRRGSGESIWDIKKKIGFVSPELHLYFLRQKSIYHPAAGTQMSYNSLTCYDVILSGLKDEIGFNSSRSERSLRLGKQWLQTLKMEHLEKMPFLHSSLGEQRIILLARALIKIPDLLILDEPCQGLDPAQTKRFLNLLNFICEKGNTTMIYVTHQAEEIPSSVTHQIELKDGLIKNLGEYSKD